MIRLLASPGVAVQTVKPFDLEWAAHCKGRLGGCWCWECSNNRRNWASQGENTLRQDLEGAGEAGGRSSDLRREPIQGP